MRTKDLRRVSSLLAFGFAADRYLLGELSEPPDIPKDLAVECGYDIEKAASLSLRRVQELMRQDGCLL